MRAAQLGITGSPVHQHFAVVIGFVEGNTFTDGHQRIDARDRPGFFPCLVQCRQQHSGKNCDYRNYDQKFNQREASHNINYVKPKMYFHLEKNNLKKKETKKMKKNELKQHNIIDIMRTYRKKRYQSSPEV